MLETKNSLTSRKKLIFATCILTISLCIALLSSIGLVIFYGKYQQSNLMISKLSQKVSMYQAQSTEYESCTKHEISVAQKTAEFQQQIADMNSALTICRSEQHNSEMLHQAQNEMFLLKLNICEEKLTKSPIKKPGIVGKIDPS